MLASQPRPSSARRPLPQRLSPDDADHFARAGFHHEDATFVHRVSIATDRRVFDIGGHIVQFNILRHGGSDFNIEARSWLAPNSFSRYAAVDAALMLWRPFEFDGGLR